MTGSVTAVDGDVRVTVAGAMMVGPDRMGAGGKVEFTNAERSIRLNAATGLSYSGISGSADLSLTTGSGSLSLGVQGVVNDGGVKNWGVSGDVNLHGLPSASTRIGNAPSVVNPYGRFGSMQALQVAAKAEYQSLVDVGYARASDRYERGLMKPGLNRNQAIGNEMDRLARRGMRAWFTKEGIAVRAHGPWVYVNSRLYNTDRDSYRIPDVRVGDIYLDASLAQIE